MTTIKLCLLFCLCFSFGLGQFGYQRYRQGNQYENRNYNNGGNYGYRENQSGYGRSIFGAIPNVITQAANSWEIFPQSQARPYNYNQNQNNYQYPNYNPDTPHYNDPFFYQNNFRNPNYQNQYPNDYNNYNNGNRYPTNNNNNVNQYPNNQQPPNFDVRFPENVGNNNPSPVNPSNEESNNETPYVFPDNSGEEETNANNNESEGVHIVETSDYQVTPSTQPTESTTHGLYSPDFESRNMFFPGFSPTCRTPDKRQGSCISLLHCKEYLDLLKNSQNPTVVNLLRGSACGFEGNTPKVCCPAREIPSEPKTDAPTTTTTTPSPPTLPTGQPKSAGDSFINNLPEPPVCGVSEGFFPRVVNGVPARLGFFPWMAILGYRGRKDPNTPRWLCGGSLISDRHVLTAAHCMNGRDDLYLIRLGELDLASETEGATPIDIIIKTKIEHQEYSPTSFTNDIGIIVLSQIVTFTSLIKPICMPLSATLRSTTFEDYTPLIAGWGDTEFRGPSATHLQMAQLPVVSNTECAQAYSAYKKQVIDERVLCAGLKQGGRDACQGDSGGPLMQAIYNGTGYNFYQIGVVSYGKKCAEPGFPGVYSRVTHFVPWITETVTGRTL